jgi:hypothetical protein
MSHANLHALNDWCKGTGLLIALEKIVTLQNEHRTFYLPPGIDERAANPPTIAETALEGYRQGRLGEAGLADALGQIVGIEEEYRTSFGEPAADEFGAKVLSVAAPILEAYRRRHPAPAEPSQGPPHPPSDRP